MATIAESSFFLMAAEAGPRKAHLVFLAVTGLVYTDTVPYDRVSPTGEQLHMMGTHVDCRFNTGLFVDGQLQLWRLPPASIPEGKTDDEEKYHDDRNDELSVIHSPSLSSDTAVS
jgi:hypothetical protein